MTFYYYFGGSDYTYEEICEYDVDYVRIYKALAKILCEYYGFPKDSYYSMLRFLDDTDSVKVEQWKDELKDYFYQDAYEQYRLMKAEG